jgi:anti-sigma B factor antagonist
MNREKMNIESGPGKHAAQDVLKVSGPIRQGALEPLQDAVKASHGSAVILDLSGVPYIDSSAIGVPVHTHVSCQKSGRKLALVGMTGRVRNVLHLASVDILFTTFESVSEAQEAFA